MYLMYYLCLTIFSSAGKIVTSRPNIFLKVVSTYLCVGLIHCLDLTYADYPWNRLFTVPVPPNSSDNWELTIVCYILIQSNV